MAQSNWELLFSKPKAIVKRELTNKVSPFKLGFTIGFLNGLQTTLRQNNRLDRTATTTHLLVSCIRFVGKEYLHIIILIQLCMGVQVVRLLLLSV